MIEIQSLHDRFAVAVIDQQISIQCEFFTPDGETLEFVITAEAIRQLSDKLQDAHQAILEKLAKPQKLIAVNLITGPTRGEVYLP